jgi:hypothetical protein
VTELAVALRACAHGFAMLLIEGSLEHAGIPSQAVPDMAARAVTQLAEAAGRLPPRSNAGRV